MYSILLELHTAMRWVVLLTLLYAIYSAYYGYVSNSVFSKTDNALRHWTATFAHIQLLVGMVLYFQSPFVKYFRQTGFENLEATFFGLIHISLMLAGIVVLTVGSAMAKRKTSDVDKFKTMLLWFTIALVIIFIAIPWPFSPLAARPYIRAF